MGNKENGPNEVNSVYKIFNHNQIKPESMRDILADKLKKRGLRGLMNLHKQFLTNCQKLDLISLYDFTKILKLQRFDFTREEYEKLFEKFKQQNKNKTSDPSFLNFSGFIRSFKNVLNEKRLEAVETAFAILDEDKTEMLFLDDIKMKFNSKRHPDFIHKRRNEDEILLEFIDCFDLNYSYLVRNLFKLLINTKIMIKLYPRNEKWLDKGFKI